MILWHNTKQILKKFGVKNMNKCPQCGKSSIALIFWGYPGGNIEAYEKAIKNKEIVPGGCLIGNDDPKWECNDCLHRWGTREEDGDE